MSDPICSTCGEPKSKHVATAKGPYTHPREARGEGTYVIVRQGYTMGAFSPGDDPMEMPARYEFRPNAPVVDDGGGDWEEDAG
jgi:hypothetical protein